MAFITVDNTGASTISDYTIKERMLIAYSQKRLRALEKINDDVYSRFGTEYPVMGKEGDQVYIQKDPKLAVRTTPLSTGVEPAHFTTYQPTHIPLQLRRYGDDIGWSTMADITMRDVADETHSQALAMQARETVAQLYVNQLDTLTVTDWTTTATLAQFITMSNNVRRNNTRGFEDIGGRLVAAIGYFTLQDLMTEGGAAYKDHYQTKSGSDVLADGMMMGDIAGTQIFVTTANTTSSSEERIYCWGDGAFASVKFRLALAGPNGKPINFPGVATLIQYVIPAAATHSTPYADSNIAVWRLGPWDVTLADASRATAAKVDAV